MRKDRVIDSLGRIDDDMVQAVEALRRKKKRPAWTKWGELLSASSTFPLKLSFACCNINGLIFTIIFNTLLFKHLPPANKIMYQEKWVLDADVEELSRMAYSYLPVAEFFKIPARARYFLYLVFSVLHRTLCVTRMLVGIGFDYAIGKGLWGISVIRNHVRLMCIKYIPHFHTTIPYSGRILA